MCACVSFNTVNERLSSLFDFMRPRPIPRQKKRQSTILQRDIKTFAHITRQNEECAALLAEALVEVEEGNTQEEKPVVSLSYLGEGQL